MQYKRSMSEALEAQFKESIFSPLELCKFMKNKQKIKRVSWIYSHKSNIQKSRLAEPATLHLAIWVIKHQFCQLGRKEQSCAKIWKDNSLGKTMMYSKCFIFSLSFHSFSAFHEFQELSYQRVQSRLLTIASVHQPIALLQDLPTLPSPQACWLSMPLFLLFFQVKIGFNKLITHKGSLLVLAWAGITKHCRLEGGLNNTHVFLIVLKYMSKIPA